MTEPTGPDESEQPPAAVEPVSLVKTEDPPADGQAPIWSAEAGLQETTAPHTSSLSRRSVVIASVAAATLILLAASCAFGVLFVLKRFQDSPTEVVQSYLQATKAQDASKLDGITCDALRTGREGMDEFGSNASTDNRDFFDGLKWKIGQDREISGDKHEVDVDVTLSTGGAPSGQVKLTFLVVKENSWKICGLAD